MRIDKLLSALLLCIEYIYIYMNFEFILRHKNSFTNLNNKLCSTTLQDPKQIHREI